MTTTDRFWMPARKDLVTILPNKHGHDEFVGGVWTIVDTQGSDALLARGDYREDMPLEHEYDLAINCRRLSRLA